MKTNSLLLVLLVLILITSCKPLDDLFQDLNDFPNGEKCNGKTILVYNSLIDLQEEHKTLYQNYFAGGEDESILQQFEMDKLHYSLRKKDEDMDNGNIPDDPTFDPFEYTSDEILEAILNQDGMVIIDNELFLWGEGCLLVKTQFSCNNYENLLLYREKMIAYQQNPSDALLLEIRQLKLTHKIMEINACEEVQYDLETISANNLDLGHDYPQGLFKSSDCGYNVFIQHEMVSNDPITKTARYRITANTISVPGTNPIFFFSIPNIVLGQAFIVDGSNSLFSNGIDWTGIGIYPGEWFEIAVHYAGLSTLSINLISVTNLFSFNACIASDAITLDLACPISIAIEPINSANGEWRFEIQGYDVPANENVTWDFGDGNTQTLTGQQEVIHAYALGCGEEQFHVSALIWELQGADGPIPVILCKNPVAIPNTVKVFDPCLISSWTETLPTPLKVDGKKVRLLVKMKKTWFSNSTRLTNKFRWRKTGEKSIFSTGNIFAVLGQNCQLVDLESHIQPNPVVRDGKKKRN